MKSLYTSPSGVDFRRSFSVSSDTSDLIPDLAEIQKYSYDVFLDKCLDSDKLSDRGLNNIFNSFFPVTNSDGSLSLHFIKYSLAKPSMNEKECIESGQTYSMPLKLNLRMVFWDVKKNEVSAEDSEKTNSGNGKNSSNKTSSFGDFSKFDKDYTREIISVKEQDVYLCDIPIMTDSGNFIINGVERVVVSQIKRAPGVFFDADIKNIGNASCSAKIVPYYGSWVDFEFDSKGILSFRIDKKRRVSVISMLKALDMSNADIIRYFYKNVESAKIYPNKELSVRFNYDSLSDKSFSFDILDFESKNLLVSANNKVTKKSIRELKKINFTNYLLSKENFDKYVIATDIVNKDGGILVSAGQILTEDVVDLLVSIGKNDVELFNPINSAIGPYIFNALALDKDSSKKSALYNIYYATRSGDDPHSIDAAERNFYNLFFNAESYNLSSVGRMKMNQRLGHSGESLVLTKEDILKIIYILSYNKYNQIPGDDIDSLMNRVVCTVGNLVENQLRSSLMKLKRYIVDRSGENLMPRNLINSKSIASAISDFFATSQLSQFMDQTNPLSEVTHKRRISALGPGGVVRERAMFEIRDVHPTHYGRICPIETPEGPNVGLINSLSIYAKVDKYGLIRTPYRLVKNRKVTEELVYLSAIEERECVFALSSENLQDGFIVDDIVECRKNGEFVFLSSSEVQYIDISPKQIMSVATTLIPFLENDDANRALMGANMQRQAVPLLIPEAPLVGTGMEKIVANNSNYLIKAKHNGRVIYVDGKKIIIEYKDADGMTEIDIHHTRKYSRTNQNTCVNQTPIVHAGQVVNKGDIIATSQSISNGELSLGKNILVAFMSWNGYNFEDSILVSERIVHRDVFTSLHIEEFEVVVNDTRLGAERLTPDVPSVAENLLANLDESGIVRVGTLVKPGDILVGKITPQSQTPVTPEEKLLRAIFGETVSEYKNTSLYLSHGVEGLVIDVKIYSRKGMEKDDRSKLLEKQEVENLLSERNRRVQIVKIGLRDSVARICDGKKLMKDVKGVKSGTILDVKVLQNLSFDLMHEISVDNASVMDEVERLLTAYDAHLSRIDSEFNKEIEKVRSGADLSHGVLKVVKVYVASKQKLQPGDKMAGRHGNKGVVSKIVPVEDMPYMEDGTPIDIILSPLGVPSRMNIGQILETHLGLVSKSFATQIKSSLNEIANPTNRDRCLSALRDKLCFIYDNEAEKIKKFSDAEVISFAQKIADGVPFAVGIFESINENKLNEFLVESGRNSSGQVVLFDGQTGEKIHRPVTVGYLYILKLHHLVDNKMHARSVGPYSLITQQPLGGKLHFGGQRFGEMECWALQAYGAAYTLQEMLTVKSDDMVGRIEIYRSIVNGSNDFYYSVPESFNVMIKEIRSLCLNMSLIKEDELSDDDLLDMETYKNASNF